MLTPSRDDPKRKEELARKKKEAATFGSTKVKKKPKDWTTTGLVKPSHVVEEEKSEVEQADELANLQLIEEAQANLEKVVAELEEAKVTAAAIDGETEPEQKANAEQVVEEIELQVQAAEAVLDELNAD